MFRTLASLILAVGITVSASTAISKKADQIIRLPNKMQTIVVVPLHSDEQVVVRVTSSKRRDITVFAKQGSMVTVDNKDKIVSETGRNWYTVQPGTSANIIFKGEGRPGQALLIIDRKHTRFSVVPTGHPNFDAAIDERFLAGYATLDLSSFERARPTWPTTEELSVLFKTLDEAFFGYATSELTELRCAGAKTPLKVGERLLLQDGMQDGGHGLRRENGELLSCPIRTVEDIGLVSFGDAAKNCGPNKGMSRHLVFKKETTDSKTYPAYITTWRRSWCNKASRENMDK